MGTPCYRYLRIEKQYRSVDFMSWTVIETCRYNLALPLYTVYSHDIWVGEGIHHRAGLTRRGELPATNGVMIVVIASAQRPPTYLPLMIDSSVITLGIEGCKVFLTRQRRGAKKYRHGYIPCGNETDIDSRVKTRASNNSTLAAPITPPG